MLETAILCLALNVFHEARGEPLHGQRAVAQVTMNRAGNDPERVCHVVFVPEQFSWTNRLPGQEERFMPFDEPGAWNQAKEVARKAVGGQYRGRFSGATHYHADYVRPYWSRKLRYITQIGRHIFYRGV